MRIVKRILHECEQILLEPRPMLLHEDSARLIMMVIHEQELNKWHGQRELARTLKQVIELALSSGDSSESILENTLQICGRIMNTCLPTIHQHDVGDLHAIVIHNEVKYQDMGKRTVAHEAIKLMGYPSRATGGTNEKTQS
jgi:hypothetical protein